MAKQPDRSPLLNPVPTPTQPSATVWRLEGEAYAELALYTRGIALNLPEESGLREKLLADADRYLLLARLRGCAVDQKPREVLPRSG